MYKITAPLALMLLLTNVAQAAIIPVTPQQMQRAVELGEIGLTELLLAQRQDFEVRRTELRARASAHSAVLQLMIDAHRIWSLGDE